MPSIDRDQILARLEQTVGAARAAAADIVIDNQTVYVTLEVDPAEGAALEPLRQQAEGTLRAIDGIDTAHVILTAERKAPPALNTAPPKPSAGFSHKISSRAVAPSVKKMIAVASGKGGVGKSTVAANLAVAFHALGLKTGLLDADIYGASQPLMMGLRQKPETDAEGMIIPLRLHGVSVISMGFFVDASAPVIWRGPMVHSAIQQLFRDVAWGDLDVLVVDLPPGTGDAQLSLAQYVKLAGAVIVSTPQAAALNEALKGLRMFEKTNVPVLGMIENMSGHVCSHCGHTDDVFGKGSVAAAATAENVPYLGDIPLVSDVRVQGDAGLPITIAAPDHPVAAQFKNIAARLWMSVQNTAAA